MNPAARTSERLALHCIRFPDAPAAEWEVAKALLAQAVGLAGIHLPAADGRLERQDATRVMAALIALGGQVPRGLKRDAGDLESLHNGQNVGLSGV